MTLEGHRVAGGLMKDAYMNEFLSSHNELPRDSHRALSAVADLIGSGSNVTVEGTPLYAGEPWGQTHEFGMNALLPVAQTLFRQRGCSVTHHAMVDDFTTGVLEDISRFAIQMRYPPDTVVYESSFTTEAENALRSFTASRRTFPRGGEIVLHSPSQPRLRVKSGRVSCELLDACFQSHKRGETHVIFHPTEFVGQQEGMREVLRELCGGRLPATFINVFFKNNAMSRVFITDTYGKTKRVNF